MVDSGRVLIRKIGFIFSSRNNLIYIYKDFFHGIILTSVVLNNLNVVNEMFSI